MANPWGKPGAWALDSEENESELLEQRNLDVYADKSADYPCLAAVATTITRKKKPVTLSLREFTASGEIKGTATPLSKGLTTEERLALPTGPRERSAEELDQSRLGGGFRSYGGGGARNDQPRRQGGFNKDSSREYMPSRADENDDWISGKKGFIRNGFDEWRVGDSGSRADVVENWASNKSFVQSDSRKYERRGSFGSESRNGGADSGNWSKKREDEGRKIGESFDSLRERRGVFESNDADSDCWGRKREQVSARPRLNLQPRSLPVGEVQKNDSGSVVKPKGANPFGAARPREEVLKEKGQDWKDIDKKLESTKIDDLVVERKSLWNGNGRERLQQGGKTENPWRKLESVHSRSSSAEETASGHTDSTTDRLTD